PEQKFCLFTWLLSVVVKSRLRAARSGPKRWSWSALRALKEVRRRGATRRRASWSPTEDRLGAPASSHGGRPAAVRPLALRGVRPLALATAFVRRGPLSVERRKAIYF